MLLKILAGVKYCVVLNVACDNVLSLVAIHFCGILDSPVIRFTAAACEIYLLRPGTNKVCCLCPRILYSFLSSLTELVHT